MFINFLKKTRGYTLNAILKKFGTNENILIVADDIEFTQGWYEKLIRNENKEKCGVLVCFILEQIKFKIMGTN